MNWLTFVMAWHLLGFVAYVWIQATIVSAVITSLQGERRVIYNIGLVMVGATVWELVALWRLLALLWEKE